VQFFLPEGVCRYVRPQAGWLFGVMRSHNALEEVLVLLLFAPWFGFLLEDKSLCDVGDGVVLPVGE